MNDNDISRALLSAREYIDLTGDDSYDEDSVHPGAVIVTFDGLTNVVVVVDDSGEGANIDQDAAEDVATDYMRYRSLIGPRQKAAYVFRVSDEDIPGYVGENTAEEIASDLEEVLQARADADAAVAHSTASDEDLSELEPLVYQEDPIYIATFGDKTAVNGDILVPPGWRRDLDLRPSAHPQEWNEAVGERGYTARALLPAWLKENGYEKVDGLSGDWPGGSEAEVEAESLAEQVARESEGRWTEEQVKKVIEDRLEPNRQDLLYWHSAGGEIEVYAKPNVAACLIEFVQTDSEDYSRSFYAISVASTKEEALENFESAVEGGEAGIWSAEAVEKGDTPERVEPYGTPLTDQSWYMVWPVDVDEADYDEDEEPENVTEMISPKSVECFDSRQQLEVYLVDKSIGEARIVWEQDDTEE